MPWPLITQKDLEDELSPMVLQRVLDDDNAGTPEVDAVTRLRLNASSKVAGRLAPVYPIDVIKAMDAPGGANPVPDEVVRLTLLVARAMVAIRHPEIFPGQDGIELMKLANGDLTAVRDSTNNLGVTGPPEPPANKAAVVGFAGRGSFAR